MLTLIPSRTRAVASPRYDTASFAEPAPATHQPSLLIKTSAADESRRLARELLAHGYRTAALETTGTSAVADEQTHWDAIVLDIETAESLPLHAFDEHTCRVLVVPTGHPDAAIRALTDFGAAAFVERPVHPGILAAILSKLCRSVDQGARMADGKDAETWRLDTTSWSLKGPDGGLARLTRAETAFLSALAGMPGEAVPRNDLIKAMGYRIDYYDQRRLDTFVSRLRKKTAAACGTPLPLRSIHAFGYAFTAFILTGAF